MKLLTTLHQLFCQHPNRMLTVTTETTGKRLRVQCLRCGYLSGGILLEGTLAPVAQAIEAEKKTQ
jgi:hypothetical protein